ncbi:putative PAP-specific phosphatase, mitochondrial isoform X2 [Cornus florida]|uniref:putative PAP-specific phosphatase, mitochondrial isoform X2 n=1 Tax=Cornus florida TaxID=4283 RepID=UPI00289D2BE2|nr:putative PAP-specific phosphatase, mitochondrial isoform X2 [Cornus florida]
MDVLHSASRFYPTRPHRPFTPLRNLSRRFILRSSLPFPEQKAKYHRELRASVDAVERACRLCVDVHKSLFSTDGRVVEKTDLTPVTVADFGVQALISLELGKLFPSIPLVAEEDSAFVRSNNLENSVLNVVTDKTSFRDKQLTQADVLEAIDRGGKDAFTFGPKPATYWVLDPIDGTKGFVKGGEALYVVGLALVVEGEIVVGVMGCPNWQEVYSNKSTIEVPEYEKILTGSGIIMFAHVGCGTWTKRLSDALSGMAKMSDSWTRCSVDGLCLVPEARICISDNQTWETWPLSAVFSATTNAETIENNQILLLPICCGSLTKYLMVAIGRASVYIHPARLQNVIQSWDHAVGIICVHEAGGKVTDWRGSKLDLAADQTERRVIYPSGGILVTNGSLHSKIEEMISSSSLVV